MPKQTLQTKRKAVVRKSDGQIVNVILADDAFVLPLEVYPDCELVDCGTENIGRDDFRKNNVWIKREILEEQERLKAQQ